MNVFSRLLSVVILLESLRFVFPSSYTLSFGIETELTYSSGSFYNVDVRNRRFHTFGIIIIITL